MSGKSTCKYSVVVPAYNESKLIIRSLKKLAKQLKEDKILAVTEVVVVCADGDDTAVKAKSFKEIKNLVVLEPGPKVGKGRDVRLGMMAATGEYILFTDADMATPPKHIRKMFQILETGEFEVAVGVRNLKSIHHLWTRRFSSLASNILIRTLAVHGVKDTQCGFKGFSKRAAQQLFEPLETLQWGFDIEVLARAQAKGYRVATIPLPDWHDPKAVDEGLSGESSLKANINTLKELLGISYARITGRYS